MGEEQGASKRVQQQQQQQQEVAVTRHGELFSYLNQLLLQEEARTGKPDLELREKLEALNRETTRAPSSASVPRSEIEIAQELDMLSARLDSVEQLISSSAIDPQAQGLLSATADLWMPAITASSDERVSIASASPESTVGCKEDINKDEREVKG